MNTAGTGDIRVDARNGTVALQSGGGNLGGSSDTPNFTQIGHGGHQVDGAQSGTITVLADAIDMDAGTRAEAYAQIGHGGFDDDVAPGALLRR